MKSLILFLAVLTTLLLSACNETGKPLTSGVVVSGKVWDLPRGGGVSNTGTPISVDAKVAVYDRLIIIHQPDGSQRVVAMELVTDLVIK